MGTADGVVFACLLGLAALLGWLEIRYLRRRDRDPEEDYRWPEWGGHGSLLDWGGSGAGLADRLAAALRGLPRGPLGLPGPVASPAGASLHPLAQPA